MSIVSIVCAMTRNRVIGRDNQMPWHLPADLAHFRQAGGDGSADFRVYRPPFAGPT